MAIFFLAPPIRFSCIYNKTCCENPSYDESDFTRTIVTEWDLVCDNSWLKDLTQTLFLFGVMTGSLLFGMASDRYGRQPSFIFAVVLEAFCGIISSFQPTYWSFTLVRMILGMSVGGIVVVGFVLVMEYTGGSYREIISALFHVPFTLGILLLALFGYFIRDYEHFQLSISMTSIVLLFYICILPESPRWLLVTNKTAKAVELMEKIAKINNLPAQDIDFQIQLYRMERLKSIKGKGSIGFYILYCPVMYLMFINQILYRKVVDSLFALWELYPVALFQWCCGTTLHYFGDYVNPNETNIIVMNHRTRVDWNYVWIALYHATQNFNVPECICKETDEMQDQTFFDMIAGGKSRIKIVLKDEIKSVPGMGWIMQLNFFLYVKRNWAEDQANMSQYVDYYKKLKYNQRIVLFPEGTDLSEDNKRKSEKYAVAKQLPVYEYVLHPRTTGWSTLCSSLRGTGLKSVYDVTVAYDRPAQTEVDLLRGKIPMHVYFYFKRYSIEELPSEEEALRTWLMNRWTEKNACLQNFHTEGNFTDFVTNRPVPERKPRSLTVAKIGFIFWTIIDVLFLYGLFYSILFRFWVIYHTLLFIFVTKYFDGFHKIQYRLLNKL